ncbi:MAG: GreA/GreB family elongation factor [Chlamydiia bacterium]
MSYLNDFKLHLDRRNLTGVLQLWEEYCAGDEVDAVELIEILQEIRQSDLADSFGEQIETALPLWEKISDQTQADAVLRLIFDLESNESSQLATLGFDWLQKRYGELPHFADKIRLVGLRGKDSFRGAIRNFELLTHLAKGAFVFHTGGWGTGEIRDVSLVREQVLLEFDLVSGRKEMSFESAFRHLAPLAPTHFLARRFGDPDAMEKEARSDPVGVIKMLLRDLGPKTASDIKEELCELVIPAKDWTRWWQSARGKLKKDTLVECPDDLKTPFRLRNQEVSHESRMFEALQTKMEIGSAIQLIYAFLRDFPEMTRQEEFRQLVRSKVDAFLQSPEATEAERFQLHFLMEDLECGQPEELVRLLGQVGDFMGLVQQIDVLAYKKRYLLLLRKHVLEWPELFAKFFLTIGQAQLRDYIVDELLRSGHIDVVRKSVESLIQDPMRAPDAFVWYFTRLMTSGGDLPFNDSKGRIRVFEAFFVLLGQLEMVGKDRELIKRMHGLLAQDRFVIVRQIMQEASLSEVREFLLLATKSPILNDTNIKILQSLAEVAHPELIGRSGAEEVDHSVWTTLEGLQKVQKRIEQLATVDTVDNAKEIEAARALGDLRENSEYKYALERRSRLQQEIRRLSDEVVHARVLTEQDIHADVVGVGSVVTVEDPTGQRLTYTLLGPWDADPERRILSFQSKLAQAMLGKTVGERVQLGTDTLQIVGLGSYLDL